MGPYVMLWNNPSQNTVRAALFWQQSMSLMHFNQPHNTVCNTFFELTTVKIAKRNNFIWVNLFDQQTRSIRMQPLRAMRFEMNYSFFLFFAFWLFFVYFYFLYLLFVFHQAEIDSSTTWLNSLLFTRASHKRKCYLRHFWANFKSRMCDDVPCYCINTTCMRRSNVFDGTNHRNNLINGNVRPNTFFSQRAKWAAKLYILRTNHHHHHRNRWTEKRANKWAAHDLFTTILLTCTRAHSLTVTNRFVWEMKCETWFLEESNEITLNWKVKRWFFFDRGPPASYTCTVHTVSTGIVSLLK